MKKIKLADLFFTTTIIKWYLTKTLHTKKCLDNAWIVLRISNQSGGLVSYKMGGL